MALERSEYRQSVADHAAKRSAAHDGHHLRLLERAALEARAVTGEPHWDYYLTCLQGAIEQTETQSAQLRENLCDPTIVNHDQIMTLKLALAECRGRLKAWTVARDLPKELMKSGDTATDLLAEIAKKESASS